MSERLAMDIKEILELHRKWLYGEEGGKRANLSDADLSDANLSDANLSDANLSDANLSGADLSDLSVWDTNFVGVRSNYKIISVDSLGSRRGRTTYIVELDKVYCGCFLGTLDEFEEKVKQTYSDPEHQHRIEYEAAIAFFKTFKHGQEK